MKRKGTIVKLQGNDFQNCLKLKKIAYFRVLI
ncbi:hypothetical protein FLTE109939_11405 [Flavobacterium terrigena]